MKFILQEDKFILNEKFLLNERFILNEDILLEAQATTKQLIIDLTKLNTLLPELLKYIAFGADDTFLKDVLADDTTTAVIEDIKTGCKKTSDLLNANPSFKETIKKIYEKASSTEKYSDEEIKVLQPLCYGIASDGNSVKDRLKSIKNQKGDFEEQLTTLQERLPKLNAGIEELHKLINPKDDEPEEEDPVEEDPNEDSPEESNESDENKPGDDASKPPVYRLNKTAVELTVGQTFKLEATSDPKTSFSTRFSSMNPVIAKVDLKTGVVKAFKAGSTEIKVTVGGKQELKCKVTVKDEEITTTDGIDWKTKFASAVNKENVIEEFIYTTWSYDQAKKVIQIKTALSHECEQYGFLTAGENANPFIQFISGVYLQSTYNVRPEIYNVIHNLVAERVLTGKDLTSTGSMGHGNLIFCKALYMLDPGAVKLYILKQYSLLNATKKPDTFESNAEMAFNILYKVPAIVKGKEAKKSTDMPLRTMAEIEQLEEKWTGEISDTTEKPKAKVATNAELIKQIDTTGDALNVLVAMAVKFSTSEEITKAVNSCVEAKQRMSKASTIAETQALVAKVERLYKLTAINASQALKLVQSILESDKFKLTKE
jgi:uncharacterized protein YjdB